MVSGIMHSVDKSEDTFVQVHLLKKVIENVVNIPEITKLLKLSRKKYKGIN